MIFLRSRKLRQEDVVQVRAALDDVAGLQCTADENIGGPATSREKLLFYLARSCREKPHELPRLQISAW